MSSNKPGRQRVQPPSPRGTTPRAPRPLPSGRTTPRTPRPLPKGKTLFTPGASPSREATERRSAPLLMYLYQLPRWVLPVLMVVLLVAGLTVHGPVGGVLLVGVAAVLGWLGALSWPRLSPGGRAGRLLGIAVVLLIAAWQAGR